MALLVVFAAGMFLLAPGRREFAASHEARVAQTAREMAAAGWPWSARKCQIQPVHVLKRLGVLRLTPDPDAPPMQINPWVVPVLTGEVRLQKPPLPYWCTAVLFKLFGASEAMARLVPCVLGAAATFLLYDVVRLLYTRRIAWCAALVWLTTYLPVEYYRLAMVDPYLAFFTLACLWVWVRAGRPVRGPELVTTFSASPRPQVAASYSYSPAPTPNAYILLFYLSLALGALSKGPLILLNVAVPVALYHVCFRRRFPGGWVSHLIGAGIFVAVALPWPLAVVHSVPNAKELWQYESVGELSGDNLEGTRPWWFYLSSLPYLALPWTGAWALSLIWPLWRRRRATLFPFAWFVLMVGVFSFVGQKKPPYLLPIMPAQVLMVAVALAPTLRLARKWRMRHWPGAVVLVQVAIGVASAVTLLVMVWSNRDARWGAVLASTIAIGLGLVALRQMLRVRPLGWLPIQVATYATVLLVFYHLYETPATNARSPKALCRELTPMIDGTHRALLVSKLPEEVAFYLPLHPPEGPAPSSYLVVLDDQRAVRERARRRVSEAPVPQAQEFQGWFTDAKVIGVGRVPMDTAPDDARYKVYELTVSRSAFALR